MVRLEKEYKEFKILHQTLLKTFRDNEDTLKLIPSLPVKKNELGSEIDSKILMQQLEAYLNTIIQSKEFERLVCLRTFFSEGIISTPMKPVVEQRVLRICG